MAEVSAGSAWSDSEVAATVAAYFRMLEAELREESFVKAVERRSVVASIGRSEGAVEFKFANISAVLRDLRLLYIRGYRPRSNYQNALRVEVENFIDSRPELVDLMARQVLRTMPEVKMDLMWSIGQGAVPQIQVNESTWTRRRSGRHIDFAQMEETNRALGAAGELAVVRHERWFLSTSGRGDLAAKVEHVAVTQGDGLGYDIQSFGLDGTEKLIEVKTTRRDAQWPFYVTHNELELSKAEVKRFCLYRLHDFRPGTGTFYVLPGALDQTCLLNPTEYSAIPLQVAAN